MSSNGSAAVFIGDELTAAGFRLTGIKTVVPNGEFVSAAIGEGLLTVAAGENVVRLLPPLIVTETEINEAISRMSAACRKLEAAATKGAA